MQTHCHGLSVTKLVRAPASADAQAGWPSEKDSCRHAARLVRDEASCADRRCRGSQRRMASRYARKSHGTHFVDGRLLESSRISKARQRRAA
jgi:hypothetical protein